jgi:Ca-activated chloride channel family protein
MMSATFRMTKGLVFGRYMRIVWLAVMVSAGTLGQSWAVEDIAVGCRVEMDREILLSGQSQRAVVKVTLDAAAPPERHRRPPVNLGLVLDRSGSMKGQKLVKAQDAAVEALRRLTSDDLFAVVAYDHNVTTVVPAQSAYNTHWIEDQIRRIRAGGNTALFAGVSQGAAELRRNLFERYVHRIILLSDGLANVGPSTPEDLGRLGAALRKEGISVTTVGVGLDYNEDLMAQLSSASDGNTYFVESSRDLPRIFAAELGDLLSIVAKQVEMVIECPHGVRPLRIIGRDGRLGTDRATLSLNQLYGGQQKYALLEVSIPPTPAGRRRDIARVRVSYEDPLTQRRRSVSGSLQAAFSQDRDTVGRSVNVDVTRDYHLNLNALAQDKAISFSDQGQKQAAVRELKQAERRLREAGRAHNDPVLLEKAEETSQKAEQIEKEGMSSKVRKVMRTDSYQLKHQQKSH